MKRLSWVVVVAVVVLCASLLTAAQSMPRVGTQSVLLILPANFHNEELVHVLQQFVDREADIYVTSVDTVRTADVAALKARIPTWFFNLMPRFSGGPRVTVIPAMVSFELQYDKAISLGAGWYDEYFAASGYTGPADPSYAAGLYWFINRMLSDHGTFGAIGAGVYPVIFSGALPQGSTVPAYPCPDLIGAIDRQGYEPKQAPQGPRPDGSWPTLVEILVPDDQDGLFLVEQSVNSSKVVMSPIPNSWYSTEDRYGGLLISDYGADYINLIDAVENAFFGVESPSPVQITHLQCGPNGRVRLKNMGERPVNLAGWKVQSLDLDPNAGEVLAEFTFSDYMLAPGAEVHVYYGDVMWSGPDDFVYWAEGVLFAGNGRAALIDPQGNRRSVRDCD